MKNVNGAVNAHVIRTADGRAGYLKNLSKYYLTCISYLPDDIKKSLQDIQRKPESLRTSLDEDMLAEEGYRQNVISMFEKVCNNEATREEEMFALDFIEKNSLDDLVQTIIPKEFDNVYTVLNNYSSLEVNHLIRSLKRILGNSAKASVISAYLGYCLDDEKIKENMSKDFVKADTARVKTIY